MPERKDIEISVSDTVEAGAGAGGVDALVVPAQNVVAARHTRRYLAILYAQAITHAATTGYTPRVRRGNGPSDAVVGEENTEALKAAAGGTEWFFQMQIEQRLNEGTATYALRNTFEAGPGNNSAVQQAMGILLAF